MATKVHSKNTKRTAAKIRALITQLTEARAAAIAAGHAPDDLATKIMTTPDPETGAIFDTDRWSIRSRSSFWQAMKPPASALAWALYLMATHPEWQARAAAEAEANLQMKHKRFQRLTS